MKNTCTIIVPFSVPDLFLYMSILPLKMNNLRSPPKWTILGPHQLPVRAGTRACGRRHCCREKSDQVQVSKDGGIPFPFMWFSNQITLNIANMKSDQVQVSKAGRIPFPSFTVTFPFLQILFWMSIIFKPFRVGDNVGVGCISDSCMNCNSKSRAVIS